jgi:hypothetical protein
LDLRLDCLSDISHLDLSLLFLIHSRGVDRADSVSVKVEGVVLFEERVRIPLGWLDGGVRAISAYDLLGLACAVAVTIDLR